MTADFIVARNPQLGSALPFLLHLPLGDGLWLKAKASWPRSARVYCHEAEPPELSSLEIIERVAAAACVKRGQAIDLVLQRAIHKRSQFVFTSFRGRPMIFWQTPKSAAASRPGVRVPSSRPAVPDVFVIDTRERYGYTFSRHGASLQRRALPAGDYAVEINGTIAAAVERKSIEDFATSLVDGSLNFAMAELANLPQAAVVVEGMYSSLLRHEYTRRGFIPDVVARLQVRYRNVPIIFAESRKFGEEWTFRFLRAAHVNAGAIELPIASALPATAAPKQKRVRRRVASSKSALEGVLSTTELE